MHTTSIRDFTKEKVLGKGSFGSVYLVRRKRDNKIYALKSVYMEKLNKKEQENSVNEVRILASVNHPNVIGYKEAFWDDSGSTLNIVMEYADDGDLHTKIEHMEKEGGFFSEDTIWNYSIQMIEGLKALHDKKIMHRDLKSANIFLVKDKHQCKIGDMNVSKVIKDKVLRTQTGTPYYASPEVWNDNPYSYKSDLWSIGCVIYELCELKPPFHGKDLDELYENVCKGKPKRIKKTYSDELWQMIMMLLQVDVNKRVDCNGFLKSELILKKIKEMKEDPKTVQEAENLDKYKDTQDDFLLKTIKFDDIKQIKSQLPSKKNYAGNNNSNVNLKRKNYIGNTSKLKINNQKINSNNINEKNIQKLKNVEKEKENIKKENTKPIDYFEIKGKIKKNETRKKKEKENNKKLSRAENKIRDNYENSLETHKTVVYNENNISIPLTEKRDFLIKSKNPKIDLINNNHRSTKKFIGIGINSERRKKTNMTDLYLKKYGIKCNNYTEVSVSKNDITDINNDKSDIYNNINGDLNSKSNENNSNDKCFTSVHRTKKINISKEDLEDLETRNTVNTNNGNKCIYNKKNIHLYTKKINIDLEGKTHEERRQSATPVYKRSLLINPILSKSNRKNKIYNSRINFDLNKVKKPNQITSPINSHKLDKFYTYGINMITPSNLTDGNNNKNEVEQILINEKDNKNKNYVKKINIKSQISERDKNSKIEKRRMNLVEENNNEIHSLITMNNNTYLNKVKGININTPKKRMIKCYLSPKCNNSQVFNNFYSINMGGSLNSGVKVINVYKK